MLKKPAEVSRQELLKKILEQYAEEIGGKFNPAVYRMATSLVPWGFSWLLNAASVKRFLPWGMKESLIGRLRVTGEVAHLQRLAKKGTILLVPTHQSNIDSVLVGYVIYLMSLPPFSYGAGLNLFSNPVLSFFMSSLGAYTVDRQKDNGFYKTLLKNYSSEILKRGIHSIFFPGGGRSRNGAIESKLKLGLLGTGLEAQIDNLRSGKPNPNVYVVPMVTSYHYVLEASSLIEQYLANEGKHRFMGADVEDHLPILNLLKFFWRFFSAKSTVTVRIGSPLDIFGNRVDEEGRSMGPNGTIIDPARWLTTRGELKVVPERDREYTRELGNKLVDAYHRENVVLTSHLVAFAYFTALRKKYPELDLYRFLRLSSAQRMIPFSRFMEECEAAYAKVRAASDDGRLYMCEEFARLSTVDWVADGVSQLGMLHDHAIIKIKDDTVKTDDMNLLYYYRNRLSGYGFSLYGDRGPKELGPGDYDDHGFLA